MPDYSKTIMYTLWSDNLPHDKIYYGHTTQRLTSRLFVHGNDKDCESRCIIEAGSYHIEEVEKWPCKNKNEALWRERWWIENNPCINVRLPIRTKEEKTAYDIQWAKRNKEKFREKNRLRAREKVKCGMCNVFGNRSHRGSHTNLCYTRFCKAFDIDADFKGIKGGVTSE
jgi:hypothetical protein